MFGRRKTHVRSIIHGARIALLGILALVACKEVKQEKVYPRGCYYSEECAVEGFKDSINEDIPELDETLCGTSVLEESITAKASDALDPLSGTTFLRGNLRIVESDLTGLDGLESLQCISGNLEIAANNSLANLDGLANLQQIGGFLKIGTKRLGDGEAGPNSALQNIDGLSNLTHLGTHLWITKNPLLTGIDALSQLTTAKNVVVTANDALQNIDGLSSLAEIRGYLKIGQKFESNASLQNIDGLARVTYIGGYTWVAYNSSLTNLDGLANVEWIGDYLGVFGNASLTSISGLNGLKTLCGILNIADNPSLPGCEAAQIPIDTKHNCSVCLRFNKEDTCPEQEDGCLYDCCVQNETCDGGAE